MMRGIRYLAIASAVVLLTAGIAFTGGFQDLGQSPEPEAETGPGMLPMHSVARIWNETLLDAIRIDRPKPPTHARNLFHMSAAMWDAWATYDTDAIGYITTEKHTAADVLAAREEAISHAAFTLLMHRFPGGGFDTDGQPCQPGAEISQENFTATMQSLGFDPFNLSTVGDSPAALGNRIGQAVVDYGLTDGAYEGPFLCYPDDSGYFPVNPECVFALPGATQPPFEVQDPNHWQQLAFDHLVLQNGIVIGTALQEFVGVAWGDTQSFAIPPVPPGDAPTPVDCTTAFGSVSPIFDPGCAPQLGGVGDAEVKASIVELILISSQVDPSDGVLKDLSPSAYGNNTLGADDGAGRPVNPFTCEPYAENIVKRGDWGRVIAEFWADGPDSETPPGHWNTLANYVTDHPDLGPKRFAGEGPVLDDLEWDVKLYFMLNGAETDSAIAAWGTKHFYDSSRPITLIRHMGGLGQSSDPGGLSYHPDGLPLVPDLIEVITEETIAPGGKHEHLAAHCNTGPNQGLTCEVEADCPDDGPFDGQCISSVGEIAIRSWLGEPENPETEIGGTGWIRAIQWITYQASNFITPPFPGYSSGHSTFSRSGAEVLAAFTGSEYFPGGLGTFTANANDFLDFENGPSETVELQWATYADAADEAGLSRRYGGIHPWYDDYVGRVQGATIGQAAFERALHFYNLPDTAGSDDESDDESDDCPDGGGAGGDDEGSDSQDDDNLYGNGGHGMSDLQQGMENDTGNPTGASSDDALRKLRQKAKRARIQRSGR